MGSTAKKEIMAEGKFLRLCREGRWEWVERVNCTGVVMILAMTPENKVLLVEQYRVPAKKFVIEFPAGLVSDNGEQESLETAARRELLEETGYEAEKMIFLSEGPPSAGMSPEVISIFLATGLKKTGEGGGDHTESILVHEIPLAAVEAWLKEEQGKGKWVDPKVYAGLYLLRGRG